MTRDLVYHLDDFRRPMTPDAFRLFAILDELRLISPDAKHSLAQCCASSLDSTVLPEAVLQLVIIDGFHQLLSADPSTLPPFLRRL